jgi:hypothetical protein
MEAAYEKTRDLKKALPNWQSLSFFMALGLAQLFAFVNFKGEGLDKNVAQFYIMAPSLILGYLLLTGHSKRISFALDDLRLIPMLAFGLLGFMLSWGATIMLLGVLGGQDFGTVPVTAVWGTIVTQVLFVACSEELLFRYALPTYLRKAWTKAWWFIPVVLSQVSFALFHWGVYGGSTFSLLIAFLFGMIMYGAYRLRVNGTQLGLGFCIGAHAAYNLVLVGVLAGPEHIITLVGGG